LACGDKNCDFLQDLVQCGFEETQVKMLKFFSEPAAAHPAAELAGHLKSAAA
jgi:hypothetical protein